MGVMTGFRIHVFDQLRRVPEGRVVTDAQLAKLAKAPGAGDTVRDLLTTDDAREHAYWRVVRRDGSLLETVGGDPAHQKKKLQEEDVPLTEDDRVDLSQCQYEPSS